MPLSTKENKKPTMDLMKKNNLRRILELGVGYGVFGPKIKIELPGSFLVGIEIFKPYWDKIPTRCYSLLFNEDIRLFDYKKFNDEYHMQCILMIDVLEHLERKDGIELLKKLEDIGFFIIVSVPIVDIEQGPFLGNEWEAHKTQWKQHELEALGYKSEFIGDWVGVFYKDTRK